MEKRRLYVHGLMSWETIEAKNIVGIGAPTVHVTTRKQPYARAGPRFEDWISNVIRP